MKDRPIYLDSDGGYLYVVVINSGTKYGATLEEALEESVLFSGADDVAGYDLDDDEKEQVKAWAKDEGLI